MASSVDKSFYSSKEYINAYNNARPKFYCSHPDSNIDCMKNIFKVTAIALTIIATIVTFAITLGIGLGTKILKNRKILKLILPFAVTSAVMIAGIIIIITGVKLIRPKFRDFSYSGNLKPQDYNKVKKFFKEKIKLFNSNNTELSYEEHIKPLLDAIITISKKHTDELITDLSEEGFLEFNASKKLTANSKKTSKNLATFLNKEHKKENAKSIPRYLLYFTPFIQNVRA